MQVEMPLRDTGWRQADVVEWLAEQLLADAFEGTAMELQGLYDGVLESVLSGV
jgi:hypothetical protein